MIPVRRASGATRASEIGLAGATCVLDCSGALYLAEAHVLLVADLHLEKGSSFASRGSFLPPYDTRATLQALALALDRYRPRAVIALGDSFHDLGGPQRIDAADRAALSLLQAGRQWIWVTGNHDHVLPQDLGGDIVEEMRLGACVLRHEPRPGEADEIAGHLHPVGKIVLRGRDVRRRCFVTDGSRCVMPAFGAYAGGLNACDPAFRPLFPDGFTAHLAGAERLYAITRPLLCGD